MIVQGFGISLERLKENDLELLREKRNSQLVSQFMEYREHITPEMQILWFNKITKDPNIFYFILEYNNKKIGMVHGTMKPDQADSEGGMFIYEQEYQNSFVPVLVSLITGDMGFYLLGSTVSHIRILKHNHRSISHNKQLGYKLCTDQENEENQLYELTITSYEKHSKKIRKALSTTVQPPGKIILTFTKNEPGLPAQNKLIELYNNLPIERKELFSLEPIEY